MGCEGSGTGTQTRGDTSLNALNGRSDRILARSRNYFDHNLFPAVPNYKFLRIAPLLS